MPGWQTIQETTSKWLESILLTFKNQVCTFSGIEIPKGLSNSATNSGDESDFTINNMQRFDLRVPQIYARIVVHNILSFKTLD